MNYMSVAKMKLANIYSDRSLVLIHVNVSDLFGC